MKTGFYAATLAALTMNLTGAFAQSNRINVNYNGQRVLFGNVSPVRMGEVTMIPLKPVLQKMGGQMKWEPSTGTVWVSMKNDFTSRIYPNKTLAHVNGNAITLDVAPRIINGQTMVPLQFFQRVLGVDTEENIATGAIVLQAGAQPAGNQELIIRRRATPARLTNRRRTEIAAYNRNRILANANYNRYLQQLDYQRYIKDRAAWEQSYQNYLANAQADYGVFQGYDTPPTLSPYEWYLYNQDFNAYTANRALWQRTYQNYMGVVVQNGNVLAVPNLPDWQSYLQAREAMLQQYRNNTPPTGVP